MRPIVSEKKARVRMLQYIHLRVSASGSGRARRRCSKESIGGLQVAGDRDVMQGNVRCVDGLLEVLLSSRLVLEDGC